MKTLIVVFFMFLALVAFSAVFNELYDAHRDADERASLIAEKPKIMEQAKRLTDASNYEEASKTLLNLADEDSDAKTLKTQIDLHIFRSNLARARKNDHETRKNLLRSIVDADPTDTDSAKQLQIEEGLLNEQTQRNQRRAMDLAGLSDAAFCEKFKGRSSDPAYVIAFRAHNGRDNYADEVSRSQISIGMNEFEVHCAWGDPTRTNTTDLPGVTEKQLVYGDRTYAYLRNGILISLQH